MGLKRECSSQALLASCCSTTKLSYSDIVHEYCWHADFSHVLKKTVTIIFKLKMIVQNCKICKMFEIFNYLYRHSNKNVMLHLIYKNLECFHKKPFWKLTKKSCYIDTKDNIVDYKHFKHFTNKPVPSPTFKIKAWQANLCESS